MEVHTSSGVGASKCLTRAFPLSAFAFWLLMSSSATGKAVPANVSSKSLVRSAKKEAREAEKKVEDQPLAKVRKNGERSSLGEVSCMYVFRHQA